MKIIAALVMMLTISGLASAKNAMHIVINDHLGTPQMLVDENRNVVWKAEYDEFGKANILVEKVEFNLRFPGQYYDKETGLHYNYYRDYDPALGRYVQSDPIGLGGGINTYSYVKSNPFNSTDFFGLESVLIFTTEPDWKKNPPDAWSKAAEYAESQALKTCECDQSDIHNLPVNTVEQINIALSSFKDISQIYIIGHASDSGIYVGSQSSIGTNISNNVGINNVSPSLLDWGNLTPDAKINIWGCHAGEGENSIAEDIAKASGATTVAPDSYLNFDEQTGSPFIRAIRFGSWNTFLP